MKAFGLLKSRVGVGKWEKREKGGIWAGIEGFEVNNAERAIWEKQGWKPTDSSAVGKNGSITLYGKGFAMGVKSACTRDAFLPEMMSDAAAEHHVNGCPHPSSAYCAA